MSKYYYLIAGLPEITLEDSKLSYSVSDFKTQIYPELSDEDRKLIDLFYLKFDNKNVLLLLKDKDAEIDPCGKYSVEELAEYIATIKEGGEIPADVFPAYLSRFVTEYFNDEPKEEGVLPEDRLSTLYYDYAIRSDNRFVAAWFGFNLTINNILVALTARKYKLDVASSVVGDTDITEALRNSNARDFGLSAEVDNLDQVLKIGEAPELVDRERQLDLLRWNWLEEETFFNYFTIERIFAFLLKLEMIERWLSLDTEKGSRLFRGIIDSLKNEIQIPPEFR